MEKENKIKLILRRSKEGLTITNLVTKSGISRSTVINILSKLDGANKVHVRKIGMAKIYSLKGK